MFNWLTLGTLGGVSFDGDLWLFPLCISARKGGVAFHLRRPGLWCPLLLRGWKREGQRRVERREIEKREWGSRERDRKRYRERKRRQKERDRERKGGNR